MQKRYKQNILQKHIYNTWTNKVRILVAFFCKFKCTVIIRPGRPGSAKSPARLRSSGGLQPDTAVWRMEASNAAWQIFADICSTVAENLYTTFYVVLFSYPLKRNAFKEVLPSFRPKLYLHAIFFFLFFFRTLHRLFRGRRKVWVNGRSLLNTTETYFSNHKTFTVL